MKTIVIVDDNLMMREFLRQLLSKDYIVQTFENGEQAMQYIATHQEPNAMIVDFEMDGLNGQELLEMIKSSGFYRDIPVILLSGKTKSETRIACLASGAKDFISKPFNPIELKLRIQNALN